MANTIADKLALAAANKAAIKAAINAKNPATAPTDVMSQWPTAIESIPTGGSEEWQPDPDWPDIRTILANDTDSAAYTNRMIALVSGDIPANGKLGVNGAQFYKFSNGTTATANGYYDVPTVPGGYRWIIYASNNPLTVTFAENPTGGWDYGPESTTQTRYIWIYGRNCSWKTGWYGLDNNTGSAQVLARSIDVDGLESGSTNTPSCPRTLEHLPYYSNGLYGFPSMANEYKIAYLPSSIVLSSSQGANWFDQAASLRRINQLDLSAVLNTNYMFRTNYSLEKLPDVLDLSSVTTAIAMFQYCVSLEKLPDVLDLSSATNVSSMFAECYRLRHVPDVLDLSSATNVSSMFLNCRFLLALPTHLTVNLSMNFSSSYLLDRDSLAEFDGDGNITGGMLYNLNACPNNGQAFTFASSVKAQFTATEWDAIKAAFSAKNWGVSPA